MRGMNLRRVGHFSGIAAAAALLVACGSNGDSSEVALPAGVVGDAAPSEQAGSICSGMVRDAAEIALDEPVQGRQRAERSGDVYSCRYEFDDGMLELAVEDSGSPADALLSVERLAAGPDVAERISGLGAGGFEKADGSIVLAKDEFVLTIDVTRLPETTMRGMNLRRVGHFSGIAAAAVMDCW